jgi:hypothetical protein
MINLKLARYHLAGDKVFEEFPKGSLPAGKYETLTVSSFDCFLDLGDDFLFGKNFILIDGAAIDDLSNYKDTMDSREFYGDVVIKDEKDPLNRFGGLFDGFTYGNGRFVLVTEVDHSLVGKKVLFKDLFQGKTELPVISIGNLHENPELYNKSMEEYKSFKY